MKFDFNEKDRTIAVYVLIVILCGILTFFVCWNFGAILGFAGRVLNAIKPLIYGFVLAFLLSPLQKICYRYLFGKVGRKSGKNRLRFLLSLIATYLIFLILLTLLVLLVVPQVGQSYSDLEGRVGMYLSAAQVWLKAKAESLSAFRDQINAVVSSLQNLLNDSYDLLARFSPTLINFVTGIVTETTNLLLGILISVYFLSAKYRLRSTVSRLSRSLFSQKRHERFKRWANFATVVFSEYLVGKLFGAILVGLAFFAFLSIFGFPYAPLISVCIALFDMIPFIGIFFGALPGLFIIFIVSPSKTIWYLLLLLLIQQLDTHFIEPRVLKTRADVSLSLMIFAIFLMGGLFGIGGMFIAVPTFAVLYAFIKDRAEKRLEKKNLPTDTADWIKTKEN